MNDDGYDIVDAPVIRPDCYRHLGPDEWEASCATMFADLDLLAVRDGCIAAAWALKVIEAYRAATVPS